MKPRVPCVAGQFYEANPEACRKHLDELLTGEPDHASATRQVLGAIVPHAGWVFSGPTAAEVFRAVAASGAPETFVLLGADHRGVAWKPTLYPSGSWATPLGDVPVDEELAQILLKAVGSDLSASAEAHAGEHSLEVQVPFIRHLFPQSRILPITVPPDGGAHLFGARLAEVLKECPRRVVVLGSSDLTHYGPNYGFTPKGLGENALAWVKGTNDRRIIDLALQMTADRIVEQSECDRSACGAGAMAATVAYCRGRDATRGVLLRYTTSHDVMPERRMTSFVGYGAILFPKEN
jgi:AmmeMemoRadiSam system protein B